MPTRVPSGEPPIAQARKSIANRTPGPTQNPNHKQNTPATFHDDTIEEPRKKIQGQGFCFEFEGHLCSPAYLKYGVLEKEEAIHQTLSWRDVAEFCFRGNLFEIGAKNSLFKRRSGPKPDGEKSAETVDRLGFNQFGGHFSRLILADREGVRGRLNHNRADTPVRRSRILLNWSPGP